MEQTLILKFSASATGAAVSSFVMMMFSLSFPAFMAGFIGAFIGELLCEKSSFKKSAITVGATSIMSAYIGSIFVIKFHSYPPTAVLGLVGFVLAYQRDFILSQLKSILDTIFKKIKFLIESSKQTKE